MSRLRYFVLASAFVVGAGAMAPRALAGDDEEDTYEVDFCNFAGDSGKVYLDGEVICSLDMKASCSRNLKKTSGQHTAMFKATAGYKVSDSFDAGTCQDGEDTMCVNFDIYDDHVKITCNGLCF